MGSKSYLDSAAYTDILLPELRHRNGEDVGFSLCHHHRLSHGSGVRTWERKKTVPIALFPQLLKKSESGHGAKRGSSRFPSCLKTKTTQKRTG